MKTLVPLVLLLAHFVSTVWGFGRTRGSYGMRDDYNVQVIKKVPVYPDPSHNPLPDVEPVVNNPPRGPLVRTPKTQYAAKVCEGEESGKLNNCLELANQLSGEEDTVAHYKVVQSKTTMGTITNQFWVINGKFGERDGGRRRRRRLRHRGRKLFQRATFQETVEPGPFHLMFGECICEPDFEHSLAVVCPNTEECKTEVKFYNVH